MPSFDRKAVTCLITPSECKGCGRCVAVCRRSCLTLDPSGSRKYAFLRYPERCCGCGACAAACPYSAISIG